jgi:hypothetical protein
MQARCANANIDDASLEVADSDLIANPEGAFE